MTAILVRFTKDVSKAEDVSRIEETSQFTNRVNESSKEGVKRHCHEVVGKEDPILPTRRKIKKRRVNRDTDKENGTHENQENGAPEHQQQENEKPCDSADLATSRRLKDPRPEWQKGLAQKILENSDRSRKPGSTLKNIQPWEVH